jgi:MerR family mercuric resistance operon transcriptional regulator
MLTRGKVAAQTGCNIETIRYYENVGLIPEPQRSASGYRSYDSEHVRLLNFIQRAKLLGFSTDQIRGLMELNDPGEPHTRAEVKALTQSHVDSISRKIKDLQKIKARLKQISSFCDGSAESARSCPILISLFDE